MNEAESSESFLPAKKVLPEFGAEFVAPGSQHGVEPESEDGAQPSAEAPQHNWLTSAVISAYETVRDHPVEITGGALAALLAIRFRGALGEGAASLADDAARLIGGKKPLPQIAGPKDVPLIPGSTGAAPEVLATNAVTESGTAITAAVRDGISFPAPWISRNGVKESIDLKGYIKTGHFDNVIPTGLQPDTIAIPGFAKGLLQGRHEWPAPFISVERAFGQRGALYQTWKDSTVQILGRKESGGGTGFFLRENGIGATVSHVTDKFEDGIFRVLMSNGEVLPARVLARESSKDVALFKVDGMSYARPFEFAPARSIKPGVRAHMIGHPDGVPEKVMNSGRIEGFNQVIKDGDTPYLGIRHSIESFGGTSGAPVIIDSGKLVGAHSRGRHGSAFGEAVSARHWRTMVDDFTRKTMVNGTNSFNGIDEYRTSVVLTQNARGMPKTEILGRKLFTS